MEILERQNHRLIFYDEKSPKLCCECGNHKFGYFYERVAYHTHYYICRSCAELPLKMRHPLHWEHPLTLVLTSHFYTTYCNACLGEYYYCSIYQCSQCHFNLDANCATLMPRDIKKYCYYASTSHKRKEEEEEEQHIPHLHSLIACDRTSKEAKFRCSMCRQHIENGTIYVCLECHATLDKSCAQLPLQITHPFHPHHSLNLKHFLESSHVTLEDRNSIYDKKRHSLFHCSACQNFKNEYCYSCSECKFNLDVRCASLRPKVSIANNYDDGNIEENHVEEDVQVQFTHPHALRPCDSSRDFSFSCSCCGILIEGTVYVCLKCGYLLHKSCAELPREIKHPFHPSHPLVLRDNVEEHKCMACQTTVRGFTYICALEDCNFAMDTICASLRPTVKFHFHNHPLAFFNKQKKGVQCCVGVVCSGHESFPYFRCVLCNFNIDLFCVPTLPRTFKHRYHRHFLTLSYFPIKDRPEDDKDSKYYCDLCEEERELAEPTYYCDDDHYVYVVHIRCVIDEILPSLEKDWSDEEVVIMQQDLDSLTAKLETLIKDLDEFESAQHIGDHQIGVMEVEIENASTEKTALSATGDDPDIVKPDEELIMLQAEIDAFKRKLETLAMKFDKFKREKHTQHIGELDDENDAGVTKLKTRDTSIDVKTFSTVASDHPVIAKPDEEIAMLQAEVYSLAAELETLTTKLDELKERRTPHLGGNHSGVEEADESDGTFPTLTEIDEEIEATTAKLEALTAKLESLRKTRARRVSLPELN